MLNSNQKYLKIAAEECAKKIENAILFSQYFESPFKHLVIDNFLPGNLAQECLENFPDIDEKIWEHANTEDIEVKYRTTWQSEFDIPEGIVNAIRIMNSSLMLKAMSKVLEIPKLMPDPYFTGGGLNATTRGGLLDVHVDGNYHDASGLHRRVNALLYLNKGWSSDWGGEFGLFDNSGVICLKKVPPLFNRLVIFDSHDYSFHGLPDPVNFPEGNPRRSIILYYYTKEPRPDELVSVNEPHSALWVKKNLLDKLGSKTRKFS
jgi:Rps23 Pro-64 3,4-dihydroxylase Tpa1-like proline 4-hydroxylase